MSEYAKALTNSVSSAASAYLQYVQDAASGEFKFFLFVEDWPDISIYQHHTNIDGIDYLPCGGKFGVFEVFRKLHSEGKLNGAGFIVDRDVEVHGQVEPMEVLRTKYYSWESHVAEPGALAKIVHRRSIPVISLPLATEISQDWSASLEKFRPLLLKHYLLLKEAEQLRLDLDLSSFPISQGASLKDGVLEPGEAAVVWIDSKFNQAEQAGLSNTLLSEMNHELLHTSPSCFGRGKTLFALWKKFVTLKFHALGRSYLGDVGSAGQAYVTLSREWGGFSYINEYLAERLAA